MRFLAATCCVLLFGAALAINIFSNAEGIDYGTRLDQDDLAGFLVGCNECCDNNGGSCSKVAVSVSCAGLSSGDRCGNTACSEDDIPDCEYRPYGTYTCTMVGTAMECCTYTIKKCEYGACVNAEGAGSTAQGGEPKRYSSCTGNMCSI